jgi:hypothetical protein
MVKLGEGLSVDFKINRQGRKGRKEGDGINRQGRKGRKGEIAFRTSPPAPLLK